MQVIGKLIANALAAALVLGAAAAAFGGGDGVVEGKVTFAGKPLAGASVYAYPDPKAMFKDEPEAAPAVTGEDGRFSLLLPAGKYYVAAVKGFEGEGAALKPGDLYSFSGKNPITVDPARPAAVTLSMVIKQEPGEDMHTGDGSGGIAGVATVDGRPLDGVVIYAYLDSNGQFRGPGYYTSTPTGVDGAFRLRMSEGTYYIIARKRTSGQLAGPLKDGDFFGYTDENPVQVRAGLMKGIDIPMMMKAEAESGSPGQVMTYISGTVKNEDGSPAEGMHVFVYKGPEMVNRPDYLSDPSRKDGSFEVSLPLGGVYYLIARDTVGRGVEPGQMWGRYDGSPDHSVEVETGRSLGGVEITVRPVE